MSVLRINVVSDPNSWTNPIMPIFLEALQKRGHKTCWVHDVETIPQGDLAFFLSCSQIASADVLARNTHNLVVHASDLPKGRGWSPLSWQVLQGADCIPLTLFEAAESVDSGPIYLQSHISLQGHELHDELRHKLGQAVFALSLDFVDRFPEVLQLARLQQGEATYYPRRTPEDSRLNLDKSLREQFDLLRIVDNENYPAFFELRGFRYVLRIDKDGPATADTTGKA